MLGDRNDILRAGGLEELGPFGGVELLCAEERNQILVALCVVAVGKMLFEILVGAVLGVVHVAWIPLVLGRRDRVHAPVNEDAELRILVPLRLLVLDERGPVGTIRAVVRLPVGFGEKAIALRVVLADRLLPLVIDLLGGFNVLSVGARGSEVLRRSLGKQEREGNGKNCRYKE